MQLASYPPSEESWNHVEKCQNCFGSWAIFIKDLFNNPVTKHRPSISLYWKCEYCGFANPFDSDVAPPALIRPVINAMLRAVDKKS